MARFMIGCFNLPGDLGRARWAKVNIDAPKEMAEFYGVTLEVYMSSQKHRAFAAV